MGTGVTYQGRADTHSSRKHTGTGRGYATRGEERHHNKTGKSKIFN